MDMEGCDEFGGKRAKATMKPGRSVSVGMSHRDGRVKLLKLNRLGWPNLVGHCRSIVGLGCGASGYRKNDRKQCGRRFRKVHLSTLFGCVQVTRDFQTRNVSGTTGRPVYLTDRLKPPRRQMHSDLKGLILDEC